MGSGHGVNEDVMYRWLELLERGLCVRVKGILALRELAMNASLLGIKYSVSREYDRDLEAFVWVVCGECGKSR